MIHHSHVLAVGLGVMGLIGGGAARAEVGGVTVKTNFPSNGNDVSIIPLPVSVGLSSIATKSGGSYSSGGSAVFSTTNKFFSLTVSFTDALLDILKPEKLLFPPLRNY